MKGLSASNHGYLKHYVQERHDHCFGQQSADEWPGIAQKRHPGFPQGVGPAMLSPEVRKNTCSPFMPLGQAAPCRGTRAARPHHPHPRRQPGTVPA